MQGSCLLWDARKLKMLKGFDEQFFMFAEEVDLQYRAFLMGWERVFVPDAKIFHHHGASVRKEPEKHFIELYKSMILFIEKYNNKYYVTMLKIIWLFGNFIRYFFYSKIFKSKRSSKINSAKYGAAFDFILTSLHRR